MTVRTQAVICLDALRHNVENVRGRLHEGCQLMAVLKGDGYGHGIAGIYPTLRDSGVERYAVAVWEEGALLRSQGATEPILVLGDTCDDCLPELLKHNLIPTIFSVETAAKLNDLAGKAGVRHPIHIKLDTGMSRIGFPAKDATVAAIAQIAAMEHLEIAGMFTHFAKADEPDGAAAKAQLDKYLDPAILLWPEAQLDAVRAGDVLFALNPVETEQWEQENFRQVLHWYTQVALVKEVPAGTEVGYGGTYTTTRKTTIATLPVGFADGYSRRLSNKGVVLIRGCEAPIIGRVCMDQMMVDVTDIPGVCRGDTVTLLGDQLTIHWMADLIDCNVDEIVCNISKRVPRVYE